VEVGEAVLALDLINTQLDLAERVLLALVQVSEGDLEDTALQGVVGVLHTLGAVDEGLADVANLKGGRSLDIVPVLAGEGIDTIIFLKGEDIACRRMRIVVLGWFVCWMMTAFAVVDR